MAKAGYSYARRALVFGDGAKGYRLQVYGIFRRRGERMIDTGIREVAEKVNGKWTTSIFGGVDPTEATLTAKTEGKPYLTVSTALDAYEAEN